jgi:hypothetical protein
MDKPLPAAASASARCVAREALASARVVDLPRQVENRGSQAHWSRRRHKQTRTTSRSWRMFTKKNAAIRVAKVAASALDFTGKKVAVVGGTDGLGRSIARLAAERGAQVTVVGRTFRDAAADRIAFVKADLSLMREAARVGGESSRMLGGGTSEGCGTERR